jgi:hypothetical protein
MKSSPLGFRNYTGETDSHVGRHNLGMALFVAPSSFCFVK